MFCACACPCTSLSRRKKGINKEGKGGARLLPLAPRALPPCGKAKGIKIDSRHGIPCCGVGLHARLRLPGVLPRLPRSGLTFAMVLLVMRLFAFGGARWTVVAFPAIIALEVLLLPKWCRRFCPWARCFRCSAG